MYKFPNHLLHLITFYFIYSFIRWGLHICMISLVSFIHFLLKHKLSVIESWIFSHGWYLVAWSELLTLALFYRFIQSDDLRYFLKHFLEDLTRPYQFKNSLIYLLFLFLATFLWTQARVVQGPELAHFSIFQSVFGQLFFWGGDFLALYYLSLNYPLIGIKHKVIGTVSILMIYSWFTYHTYIFKDKFSLETLSFYLLILTFVFWQKKALPLLVMIILFYIIPYHLFLGKDLIWGSDIVILQTNRELGWSGLLVLFAIMGIKYSGTQFFINDRIKQGEQI